MNDFDLSIDRRGTGSYKWDFMPESARDATPMWIADMEFKAPAEVINALRERAEQGIYGYTLQTDEDMEAARNWCEKRNGQKVPAQWLLSAPGVVYAMRAAIMALTNEGDGIVVQPPIHTPFFVSASRFGRRLVKSPLIEDENGRYTMDFDHLESCFKEGCKLLLMCSPHNPVGRVWTMAELKELAGLLERYDVRVISDEIHRDIIMPGFKHIPLATLAGMESRVITLFSPSKTFNLGGFQIAAAIIADPVIREKTRARLYDIGHCCGRPTLMSIVAQTAAYKYGSGWLDEMITYLDGNYDVALEALKGLDVSMFRPEATYMFWLNTSRLGLQSDALMSLMTDKAKVLPEPGYIYDGLEPPRGIEKHLRFNVAMPREQLSLAMGRVREALISL